MSGFFSLGPIFCSFCFFCLIFLRLDGVLLTTLAPALCFCLVCGALLKSSFIFPFLSSYLSLSLILVLSSSRILLHKCCGYFSRFKVFPYYHHHSSLVRHMILSEIQSHFTSTSRTCKNLIHTQLTRSNSESKNHALSNQSYNNQRSHPKPISEDEREKR